MATQDNIFSNNIFNLRLTNDALEDQFQQRQYQISLHFNTKSIAVNLLCILTIIILLTINYFNNNESTNQQEIIWIIFTSILLFLIILAGMLQMIYKESYQIQIFCALIHYYIFAVFLIIFRNILFYMHFINMSILLALYYFDYLSKLCIICSKMIDYNIFFRANLLVYVSIKIICYFDNSCYCQKESYLPCSIEDIFVLVNISISNWIMKKSRVMFYYMNKVHKQNAWYKDLLNSINTAFLKNCNGKIVFINKHCIQVLLSLGLIKEEDTDDMQAIIDKSDEIMKNVFQRIQFIKDIIDNHIKETELNKNYKNCSLKIFTRLKDYIILNNSQDNNSFVGYVNIEELNQSLNYVYECYCRYIVSDEGEGFEFILNNVTRTKILEEKNAELRIKSTFLSKIAHEFKNPLLCLNEIANKKLTFNKETIKADCLEIKSITNYLIILIKNIDLFSQMQCNPQCTIPSKNKSILPVEKKNQLTIAQCHLDEVFDFVTLISDYLIEKKKSKQLLQFKIFNKTNLKVIETDEIKLKQLLINLISNALKFTFQGEITLTIDHDDDHHLKFSVKDTGIGIAESHKSELYNPFYMVNRGNDNVNNHMYGTGLGLSIANELACSLGNGLSFESTVGKGTVFWFNLDKTDSTEEDSQSQISTSSLQTRKDESLFPMLKLHLELLRESTDDSQLVSSLNQMVFHKLTILIADDDDLLRKSSIRLIQKYADSNNITLDILEASDGLELLWIYYDNIMNNKPIDIILSDQNMVFYSGNKAAFELKELCSRLGCEKPKFFILSSSDYQEPYTKYINGSFRKPLAEDNLSEILSYEFLSINCK